MAFTLDLKINNSSLILKNAYIRISGVNINLPSRKEVIVKLDCFENNGQSKDEQQPTMKLTESLPIEECGGKDGFSFKKIYEALKKTETFKKSIDV